MADDAPPNAARPRRWLHISEVQRLMAVAGYTLAPRTLREWCQLGKLPARKRLSSPDWWIDLRAIKGMGDDGGDVYEDIVRALNSEAR